MCGVVNVVCGVGQKILEGFEGSPECGTQIDWIFQGVNNTGGTELTMWIQKNASFTDMKISPAGAGNSDGDLIILSGWRTNLDI